MIGEMPLTFDRDPTHAFTCSRRFVLECGRACGDPQGPDLRLGVAPPRPRSAFSATPPKGTLVLDSRVPTASGDLAPFLLFRAIEAGALLLAALRSSLSTDSVFQRPDKGQNQPHATMASKLDDGVSKLKRKRWQSRPSLSFRS